MGLSFNTVEKTYKIFHTIKTEFLPELRIPSWPEDMADWNNSKKENPPLNEVLGWDKKYDNGWENICFFTKKPDPKLVKRFKALAQENIGNSIICGPYKRNKDIWCIGWF